MCSVTLPLRLIESPLRHLNDRHPARDVESKAHGTQDPPIKENSLWFSVHRRLDNVCSVLDRPRTRLPADGVRAPTSVLGPGRLPTTQEIWTEPIDIVTRSRSSGLQHPSRYRIRGVEFLPPVTCN